MMPSPSDRREFRQIEDGRHSSGSFLNADNKDQVIGGCHCFDMMGMLKMTRLGA